MTRKELPDKGEVYWVKSAGKIELAFYLGSPSEQFYPWYKFEVNEPITNVETWIPYAS